jgi:Flp pilus assembly protein TadB
VDEQARRVLRDIENNLRRDDPAFAARMRGERRRFPVVPALCGCLYIVIPLVSLLFGMLAVIITFNAAVVVVIATVLVRRRSRR